MSMCGFCGDCSLGWGGAVKMAESARLISYVVDPTHELINDMYLCLRKYTLLYPRTCFNFGEVTCHFGMPGSFDLHSSPEA